MNPNRTKTRYNNLICQPKKWSSHTNWARQGIQTRGTANTSAGYWSPWIDLTLDEKKEFATDNQAYGIIEDNVNLTQTKAWSQGSLTGNRLRHLIPAHPLRLVRLLCQSRFRTLHAYLQVGETAQHQSYTFLLHDPLSGVDYSYANGVVEKLEINFALKQFVQFTASLLAQSGVSQSAFSPSTTTENRFLPQYLAAGFAPTYTGVTGALHRHRHCILNHSRHFHVYKSFDAIARRYDCLGTSVPVGATVAKLVSSTAYDLSVATTGNIGTQTFGPAVVALKSAKVTFNSNVEAQEVLGNVSPADFLNKEF